MLLFASRELRGWPGWLPSDALLQAANSTGAPKHGPKPENMVAAHRAPLVATSRGGKMVLRMTVGQLTEALRQLPVQNCLAATLEAQALRLAESVRANLSSLPGETHDQPWQQTGTLKASIAVTVADLTAEIGTNDPAAAPQEFGTRHVPPRPFVLPVLESEMGAVVDDIGTALLECLSNHVA